MAGLKSCGPIIVASPNGAIGPGATVNVRSITWDA